MRTPGQGQAAVPGERERRRRDGRVPAPPALGRGEKILRTVTDVERYPGVPGESGDAGSAMRALK